MLLYDPRQVKVPTLQQEETSEDKVTGGKGMMGASIISYKAAVANGTSTRITPTASSTRPESLHSRTARFTGRLAAKLLTGLSKVKSIKDLLLDSDVKTNKATSHRTFHSAETKRRRRINLDISDQSDPSDEGADIPENRSQSARQAVSR
ncbi:hypothetical protein Bca52824_027148 [Brassica carinata]|uniref:Uncharacterized protein n=1 Tax=Brassica carinata TaxID=52824 RepID=A0A8X7SIY1_BRACI|nr:hypothetical protein Bca52824_027148 [Brassica carinata]